MNKIKISDIEGIKIGNAQNIEAGTGCTVVICEEGASAGVDVRGGAPGTRETALLNPVNLVQKVHAVLLAGGSAFGLDAASGIMKYLEEKNIGFDAGVTKVPIVPGAVLFDLAVGDCSVRPDKEMGYSACLNAEQNIAAEGNVGAGTGATIGKILGPEFAMKGGLGVYALQVGSLKVGAIVAVNCLGDVTDPDTGEIIAGVLNNDKKSIGDTEKIMFENYDSRTSLFNGNTTIGIVVTNADLNKSEMNKVASMAHNGYARSIKPAHTMFDGDTIFALATGKVNADINAVGHLSSKVVEKAVVSAVKNASSLFGYSACKDLIKL